eukprot:TRINITY_DN6103_c0_g1_i1.p1 TRINITY_DN6103_c0_g1~~TRINITY_DN6103_c0_g1_i1.p1  ORF type:complete len:220 (+),score=19.42 TRINITY_DN6103_c0_g1_i1:96-755(+)
MASFEELTKEQKFTYDTTKYDFRGIVRKMMDYEDLEQVHKLDPQSTKPGLVEFKSDQSTIFHRKFYQSEYFEDFLKLYWKFLEEIVAPMFAEKELVYQKRPTFRIHLPNNVAVGTKHCDSDLNHPDGEINFWIPFTRVIGNNGFYTESEPGKGDFHPISPMEYGQMLRFYGSKCIHYNEINDVGCSRLSVDFRIIPKSIFKPCSSATVKSGMTLSLIHI